MRIVRVGLVAVGLALVTGCAGAPEPSKPSSAAAAVDWTKAEPVTVRIEDYRFVPNRLAFRRGVPYQLRLENAGPHQHEFTSPGFFGAISARNRDVVSATRPEIVVDPGQAKELYFVPVAAGRYELLCADHDFAGMTGEIVVE